MLARNSVSKVCPCVGGRCLTASLSNSAKRVAGLASQNRDYSTEPQTATTAQSIFSPFSSTWDNVFEDIKTDVRPNTITNPRLIKRSNINMRLNKAPRPEAITASETQAIADMFTQIFENTALHKDDAAAPGTVGLGRPRRSATLNNVYNKLRSHSQKLRWTTEADQELDRKKEEMELCETDAQLLDWAMREVFGEFARPLAQRPSAATKADASAPQTEPQDASASSSPPPSSSEQSVPEETVQHHSSSYPHLLAALMRTFREKYKDPHLALALFNHARHLSIASYVFGCTTPAYNELIETRWRCFRDLRAVVELLEEMRVNGVEMDGRTRMLGERIRGEVGTRTYWQEENSIESGEVRELMSRLERLTVVEKPKRARRTEEAAQLEENARGVRKRRWNAHVEEEWKRNVLAEAKKETYQFERYVPKTQKKGFEIGSAVAGDKLKAALAAMR
ncbi:hypothetical protein PYCCODRAFT_1392167 [Trametes coccinea BRFM310]|uniref:Mtf2-like C-terminal domain-containing protein n=1 Tax=Trametes coccinea (strain BRFM310) TaxID=1353009 RepID=A0A1Y2IJN5_TRAC3|nr:hypothetical protein PYCCODRAFT_1392167 [Trametes coccinea BRFM310]